MKSKKESIKTQIQDFFAIDNIIDKIEENLSNELCIYLWTHTRSDARLIFNATEDQIQEKIKNG